MNAANGDPALAPIHAGTGRANSTPRCCTCKTRKVKCDAAFPACRRCMSTGRVCDGYGIWGGGGSAYSRRQVMSRKPPQDGIVQQVHHRMPVPSGVLSEDESSHFDWFMHRTATKLPGCFASAFWHTLVLQASCKEPAVLHAALALSSAHRSESRKQSVACKGPPREDSSPDELEKFTLQQYSKAIRHLQRHFSVESRFSTRVVLVSCVVFVCIEFLCEHYRTGHEHLRTGMQLLNTITGRLDGCVTETTGRDVADEWLVEVLCKLNLQAAMLGQGLCRRQPQVAGVQPVPPEFTSIVHARQLLDQLTSDALFVQSHFRDGAVIRSDGTYASKDVFDLGRRLQPDLILWREGFERSTASLKAQTEQPMFTIARQLLLLSHAMATIMAATCLQPDDEMAYDCYLVDFVCLVDRAVGMLRIVLFEDLSNTPFKPSPDVSHFIADIGWIPPVYYAALKCRNHRARLHCIRLLTSIPSKEGSWDSNLAASVARHVMEVEEGGFYDHVPGLDDFSYDKPVDGSYIGLETLPEACRLHDVQLLPQDGLSNATSLTYKWKGRDGTFKLIRKQYDAISKTWKTI